MSKKPTKTEEKAPERYTCYRMLRPSLLERQLVEVVIEGDKIVEVKAGEADLGRIIMSKLINRLMLDEDK